jgi:uncharacterized protein involved in exopolysaccharide biosynthesis
MPTGQPSANFSFPLPFDPLRLLYGIRERWYWFLVLPALLGAIGYIAGAGMAENRYSVSLQLIKNDVPTTLQMSEAGQSFRPRDLSDDTLLATTYSTEVLRRTGQRLDPARSATAVKSMVEINKQRNTSLFYLTAHSRISADDAVQTVAAWAEEIIRFTDGLQREEARVMQQFLAEQYANLQRQLEENNRAILEFSREHQFVDVEAQTEAAIRSLEDVRMQLLETRLQREALAAQITRYRDELRAQSPLTADLRLKREELVYLRGRYTDNNPLVQEKLYEIAYLEQQIEEASSASGDDLKQFTGSELGNNLYLEIIALENERETLGQRIAGMETLLETRSATFSDLPEKSLGLSELRSRRDQLLNAIALIEGRRKEAAFYESNAPGYWRVFQQPDRSEVSHSSQNMKAVLLAMAGASSGTLLALLFALIWEYSQPGLRSVLETALVTGTRPVLRFVIPPQEAPSWWCRKLYPHPPGRFNPQRLRAFWITQSLRLRESRIPGLLFVVTGPCVKELLFWQELLQAVHNDGQKVAFYDLETSGTCTLAELRNHPAICAWQTGPTELPANTPALAVVRMDQLAQGQHVAWLRRFGPYFWLSSPSEADRRQTRELTDLVRDVIGPPAGLIVIDQSSGRTVPRTLASLETMLLQLQSKPARASDA